jgi:hypothetical protein
MTNSSFGKQEGDDVWQFIMAKRAVGEQTSRTTLPTIIILFCSFITSKIKEFSSLVFRSPP